MSTHMNRQTRESKSTMILRLTAMAILLACSHGVIAGVTERAPAQSPESVCTFLGLPPDCFSNDDEDDDETGTAAEGDDPTGMWHLFVEFPEMPPFLEILVFHHGGTLTESNFSLHGNSANPFFPFNGSEGHGIWQINEDGTTSFAFQKMAFDAENDNAPVGFLRVKGTAILDDGVWQELESNTALITPDGFVIADFGQAEVSGMKLSLDMIE